MDLIVVGLEGALVGHLAFHLGRHPVELMLHPGRFRLVILLGFSRRDERQVQLERTLFRFILVRVVEHTLFKQTLIRTANAVLVTGGRRELVLF